MFAPGGEAWGLHARQFPTAAPKPRRCSAAVSVSLPHGTRYYLGSARHQPLASVTLRRPVPVRAAPARAARNPGCLPSAALAASWPLRFKVLPLRAAGLDLETPGDPSGGCSSGLTPCFFLPVCTKERRQYPARCIWCFTRHLVP